MDTEKLSDARVVSITKKESGFSVQRFNYKELRTFYKDS